MQQRHSSAFLTVSNIKVLLTDYAAIRVVAVVRVLLVIAGQVDLSVGSNIAFSGMVAALARNAWLFRRQSACCSASVRAR